MLNVALYVAFLIFRLNNGMSLPPPNQYMCNLALTRAQEIQTDFSHNGFYSSPLIQKYKGTWDENLAYGFMDANRVMLAWEKSPTHLKNLEAPMKYVCFVESGKYWVMESYNY